MLFCYEYNAVQKRVFSLFLGFSYSVGNPVNFLEGPQLNIGYRFDISPFDTRQDFIDFLSRMKELPDQVKLRW